MDPVFDELCVCCDIKDRSTWVQVFCMNPFADDFYYDEHKGEYMERDVSALHALSLPALSLISGTTLAIDGWFGTGLWWVQGAWNFAMAAFGVLPWLIEMSMPAGTYALIVGALELGQCGLWTGLTMTDGVSPDWASWIDIGVHSLGALVMIHHWWILRDVSMMDKKHHGYDKDTYDKEDYGKEGYYDYYGGGEY